MWIWNWFENKIVYQKIRGDIARIYLYMSKPITLNFQKDRKCLKNGMKKTLFLNGKRLKWED